VGGFRTAIVIPAHNEASAIGKVVKSAKKYGDVIVVDDASTDETGERARSGGALIVTHNTNQGYDGALNSGFKYAETLGYDFVVTLDADGQHPADKIGLFIENLKESAEVVVGVRPRKQRLSEMIFGMVTRFLYRINDPLCGMKGYRMTLYKEVGHFDCYQSIGTELMLYAAKNRRPVKQVFLSIEARKDASRFGSGWRSDVKILRALSKHWMKKYGHDSLASGKSSIHPAGT
jgi:glycosyltransferase involved in cell wall biosynthesis